MFRMTKEVSIENSVVPIQCSATLSELVHFGHAPIRLHETSA